VTCQIPAGAAQDAAGNGSLASNTLSVTFDSVGPVATVASASPVADTLPIVFTISFNEAPVVDLTLAGVEISGGAAQSFIGSGSGPYTVLVLPSIQGQILCQVSAGAVQDAAGNTNEASNIAVVLYQSEVGLLSAKGWRNYE
jgi:hypothetical protein